MKINLISENDHKRLIKIAEDFPNLIFQNVGYQYIHKSRLTTEELEKFKEVETLLKDHIFGFGEFNNFLYNKKGELNVRFQYNYNYDGKGLPFYGVGYLKVDELLNGFE